MIKLDKLGLICTIGAIAITTGITVKSFAFGNDGFTPQQKMSAAEMEEMQQAVDKIYTKYGVFKRIPSGTSVDSTNAAYDKKAINSSTKVLITKDGTFIRVEE
ncbi:hypothetical protein [Paenibacillus sp. GCM10012303]|jgi:hypothetical protein|uniref:hypothetical protein n=1 Tax=Paenibacillus sp. GCM10012303 TaxID=3317340 RepID=UPI003607CFAE